ncbi:polysaccharide deacetylase family protein [Arachidicoccus terrestris]|uniref:polysaccharide deacetylase family protein n=1 Tax=Arachidicoccus terrestris TaxID=2875539 RepID=UPI001CC4A284|nr:polysaccharide deacetylase family protein [Arachidicoccus terrestris]
MYLIKSNILFKLLYPGRTWKFPLESDEKKVLYLSFDDGPHPVATPFALKTLKDFKAKASFFCLGKNVRDHPDIYRQILLDGHSVGNHSFNHLNGWKSSVPDYIQDIEKARDFIDSPLFRPPYGRMSKKQQSALLKAMPGTHIIMWDLLSGDFDTGISPQRCWSNVKKYSAPGSIIVFHDSTKAYERMQYALPATLEHFSARGYVFKAIPMQPAI